MIQTPAPTSANWNIELCDKLTKTELPNSDTIRENVTKMDIDFINRIIALEIIYNTPLTKAEAYDQFKESLIVLKADKTIIRIFKISEVLEAKSTLDYSDIGQVITISLKLRYY